MSLGLRCRRGGRVWSGRLSISPFARVGADRAGRSLAGPFALTVARRQCDRATVEGREPRRARKVDLPANGSDRDGRPNLRTLRASQAGDANYNSAPDVSRTFSIARAPCTVPKVVGKQLASAKLTIARRHCSTGKVGHAYSRKRKRGIVLSQSRRPGRVLPARSKINLTVSRGRRQ
jgi:PASTA domain